MNLTWTRTWFQILCRNWTRRGPYKIFPHTPPAIYRLKIGDYWMGLWSTDDLYTACCWVWHLKALQQRAGRMVMLTNTRQLLMRSLPGWWNQMMFKLGWADGKLRGIVWVEINCCLSLLSPPASSPKKWSTHRLTAPSPVITMQALLYFYLLYNSHNRIQFQMSKRSIIIIHTK